MSIQLFLYLCLYASTGAQIKCHPVNLPYNFRSVYECQQSVRALAYAEAIKLRRRYPKAVTVRWVFQCRSVERSLSVLRPVTERAIEAST